MNGAPAEPPAAGPPSSSAAPSLDLNLNDDAPPHPPLPPAAGPAGGPAAGPSPSPAACPPTGPSPTPKPSNPDVAAFDPDRVVTCVVCAQGGPPGPLLAPCRGAGCASGLHPACRKGSPAPLPKGRAVVCDACRQKVGRVGARGVEESEERE